MNEAYLKGRLKKAVQKRIPSAVIFRHEDQFTGGIPDMSVTAHGSSVWVEVKWKRGKLTPLQRHTLERIGNGAMAVSYLEGKRAGRQTGIEFFSHGRSQNYIKPGWDHEWVADCILSTLVSNRDTFDPDYLGDVRAFHEDMKLPIAPRPKLDFDVAAGRCAHLEEEVTELRAAISTDDLPAIADAVVDIVYLALGVAINLGIPFDAVWQEVQRANMKKTPGTEKHGVSKPDGWKAPDVGGILARVGWKEEA
jgi:predicted HAD superfamily Cof-like phosphohydrolase